MQDQLRKKMSFLVVALMSGAMVAACSSDSTGPGGNNNGPPEENVILLQADSFAPATDTISAGTEITWRNAEPISHTITSDNDEWEHYVVPEEEGEEFRHTFNDVGTYDYECQFHEGMVGTIVVE